MRRVWSHWCYARGIAKRAAAHVAAHGKPDVILFSVPPMEAGAVALKLGRRYGARVVLDVMDAWPDTLLLALPGVGRAGHPMASVLRSLSAVFLWPYYRMMRRYCREADAVCAQSQAFADYARSFGAAGEIPVFYLGAKGRTSRHDHSTTQRLNLLYLGSMGRVYDLGTLIDAVLQLLQEGASVQLDLVGAGGQQAALEARVAAAGQATAIRFHGYLSGEALDSVLAEADVGVIPMDPASKVAVPYKAADYLSYGLVLVNSLPGELEAMLERYACGTRYTAGSVDSLTAALRPWLEQPAALEQGKAGARKLFEAELDAAKVYPAMADFLESQAGVAS